MPKSRKKSSPKDVMLSIIFLGCLLLGFVLVAIASEGYTNDVADKSLVFQTDSNTLFPDYEVDGYIAEGWSLGSGVHFHNASGYFQTNFTPAYYGNGSWLANIDSYGSNYQLDPHTVMNMPNGKKYLITDVYFNTTLPPDNDKIIGWAIYHHNIPFTTDETGNVITTQHTQFGYETYTDETNISGHVELELTQSARIYSLSQETAKTDIIMMIGDDDNLGMSGWAWIWDVQVYGKLVSGWSLNTTITAILGFSSFLNVIVAVYMTDSIDLKGW